MKKLLTLLFVAISLIAMSSCGQKKENPELDAKLVKYEKVCDQVAEMTPALKAGDTSQLEEYSTLVKEMTDLSMELASECANMTQDQMDRMTKAAKKVEKVGAE